MLFGWALKLLGGIAGKLLQQVECSTGDVEGGLLTLTDVTSTPSDTRNNRVKCIATTTIPIDRRRRLVVVGHYRNNVPRHPSFNSPALHDSPADISRPISMSQPRQPPCALCQRCTQTRAVRPTQQLPISEGQEISVTYFRRTAWLKNDETVGPSIAPTNWGASTFWKSILPARRFS